RPRTRGTAPLTPAAHRRAPGGASRSGPDAPRPPRPRRARAHRDRPGRRGLRAGTPARARPRERAPRPRPPSGCASWAPGSPRRLRRAPGSSCGGGRGARAAPLRSRETSLWWRGSYEWAWCRTRGEARLGSCHAQGGLERQGGSGSPVGVTGGADGWDGPPGPEPAFPTREHLDAEDEVGNVSRLRGKDAQHPRADRRESGYGPPHGLSSRTGRCPVNRTDAQDRVLALREATRPHDHRYYVLDAPEVSDAQYAALMRELVELEEAHPELVVEDSPTQRVAGAPSEQFAKVVHSRPMLSLQN